MKVFWVFSWQIFIKCNILGVTSQSLSWYIFQRKQANEQHGQRTAYVFKLSIIVNWQYLRKLPSYYTTLPSKDKVISPNWLYVTCKIIRRNNEKMCIQNNLVRNVLFNVGIQMFNPLSVSPSKWSNTLKQFIGNSRRIVWVCLTILWVWRLKG